MLIVIVINDDTICFRDADQTTGAVFTLQVTRLYGPFLLMGRPIGTNGIFRIRANLHTVVRQVCKV